MIDLATGSTPVDIAKFAKFDDGATPDYSTLAKFKSTMTSIDKVLDKLHQRLRSMVETSEE